MGKINKIFIYAPPSLMIASMIKYPQYGACQYFFDGQIIQLLPTPKYKEV